MSEYYRLPLLSSARSVAMNRRSFLPCAAGNPILFRQLMIRHFKSGSMRITGTGQIEPRYHAQQQTAADRRVGSESDCWLASAVLGGLIKPRPSRANARRCWLTFTDSTAKIGVTVAPRLYTLSLHCLCAFA